MLTLVVTVLLAITSAYFATQNTSLISLNFGGYILTNIPLYLAILIPLLLGLVLSFLFHLVKDLSSSLSLSEQKDRTKRLKKELDEVTKQAHKLEVENAKLKTQIGEPTDENSI